VVKQKFNNNDVALPAKPPVPGVSRPDTCVIRRKKGFSARVGRRFHDPNSTTDTVLKAVAHEEKLWDKIHGTVVLGLQCQANDAERLLSLLGLEFHIVPPQGDTDAGAFSFHGRSDTHSFKRPLEVIELQFSFFCEEAEWTP
jgi:hypothetical protein